MSKTSETGHAKNVANLSTAVSILSAVGGIYNPAREDQTIVALTKRYDDATKVMAAVLADEKLENDAVAARLRAYNGCKAYGTLVMNAVSSSNVSTEKITEVKAVNRKIQGARAVKKPVAKEGEEAVKTNSVSQQSYDSIIEHFKSLYGSLVNEKGYNPNEQQTSLAGLQAYIANLEATNKAANLSVAKTRITKEARQVMLYASGTGLVDVMAAIKMYCRSVAGLAVTYKGLVALAFKRIELRP